MNSSEHAKLKRQDNELLQKGFIRERLSPCVVPTLLKSKKNGSWRICVNNWSINRVTVKYHFPIPRLNDMLDMIVAAQIFSKIDLKSKYHHIRICPENEWKIAFKTKDNLYEWLAMSFDISNAPRTFMREMTQVLKPFMKKSLVVHFDDVPIYSKIKEGHLDHLIQVCTIIRKESLFANVKNCSFFINRVIFLGFIVLYEKISIDPKKSKQL